MSSASPRALLRDAAHRPWPLPDRPWVLRMRWEALCFLHWPVAPAALRPHLPAALDVDTFDGHAWLGVVPFRMAGVRPRGVPGARAGVAFPELNLRTYVRHEGRAGVWFFSLDAASRLAVRLARALYHLPYFDARMHLREEPDGAVRYTSARTHRGAPAAAFEGTYAPVGPVQLAAPGTIEHWLTERYALFAADARGVLRRGDIHHRPWPLQPAAASLAVNTLAATLGLALPDAPPLAHYARALDVVAWWPQRPDGPPPR